VRRLRTVNPVLPAESGCREGLAYTLWLPETPASAGILVLHGAGSCKESHYDFARAALPLGFAALTFDQRGHGESEGPMDRRVLEDVESMAGLLRERLGEPARIALRGSSMGGYLAIIAAGACGARGVVAICPAPAEGLRRALHAGALSFDADRGQLDDVLAEHDLEPAVEQLEVPLLLLHAEGDEQVPVQHSRELAEHMHVTGSRLIAVPGGHHRSIQHDGEIQAFSLRWLQKALS